MDRVRFGRALGKGARLAAQTAWEAADAATAPAPIPRSTEPESRKRSVPAPTIQVPSQMRTATRAAAAGVAGPLREASRALWHELTGSFFALFALSFGAGAWHTRAGIWSPVPADRHRVMAFGALSLLFLYFSVSSFLRARRRK